MSFSHQQVSVLQAMGIDVWRSNETSAETVSSVDHTRYWTVQAQCQSSGNTWLWFLGDVEPTEPELSLLAKILQAVQLQVVHRPWLSFDELKQLQPQVLVCLGVDMAKNAFDLPKTVSIGWQGEHPLCQRSLVTHTLSEMLQQPACKKTVWRDLQALQPAVLGG